VQCEINRWFEIEYGDCNSEDSVMFRLQTSHCRDYRISGQAKKETFKSEYHVLISKYPNTDSQMKCVYKVLCDTEDLVGYTPASARKIMNGPVMLKVNFIYSLT
jgi:hypothetical protein